MNTYKHLHILLASLMALAVVTSSCDEENVAPASSPTLTVVASDLLFDSSARTGSVEFDGSAPLEVVSTSVWCQAHAEGTTVYVSVEGNDSFDGRTAILTVRDAVGRVAEIPVQQRGMVIETIGETSRHIATEGETLTYVLHHDKPMTFSTNVGWIHPAVVGDTVTIVVDSNVGGFIRRGTVTYESGGYSHTLELSQYDIKQEIEGTYLFGGFNNDAVMATRVELHANGDKINMVFVRNANWAEMPLDFDEGRCVLTLHSGFFLSQASSSDYDVFYLYDSEAGRLSSSDQTTMTAKLFHNEVGGEGVTYAFLEDGGTWPSYTCDGFIIRASRQGLLNYTMMQVTSPYLLRMGPLGMPE